MTRKWAAYAVAILCSALTGSRMTVAQSLNDSLHGKTTPKVHVTFSQALPRLDGGHLAVKIVEVSYLPGGYSAPHSHPCPVVGYVLEGALRIQVKGGPETIYKVGESFYEAPNSIHLVSANASSSEPAKLLAYFVCDHETPLTVAVPKTKTPDGK